MDLILFVLFRNLNGISSKKPSKNWVMNSSCTKACYALKYDSRFCSQPSAVLCRGWPRLTISRGSVLWTCSPVLLLYKLCCGACTSFSAGFCVVFCWHLACCLVTYLNISCSCGQGSLCVAVQIQLQVRPSPTGNTAVNYIHVSVII